MESCEGSVLRFRTTRYLWYMYMMRDNEAAWLSCCPLQVKQTPPEVSQAKPIFWGSWLRFPSLRTAAGTTCASNNPKHEPGSPLWSLYLLLEAKGGFTRSCLLSPSAVRRCLEGNFIQQVGRPVCCEGCSTLHLQKQKKGKKKKKKRRKYPFGKK